MSYPKTPWIAVNRPQPAARLRLFCFPYSGAPAAVYYPWADLLPSSIELCALQYPGRGTRLVEPLAHALDDLVASAAQALRPYLDKPFAFFGHSLGALVSYELARALESGAANGAPASLQPLRLFVSGHAAPSIPDPYPRIHHLPQAEFIQKIRELNGTPPEILEHPELMEILLPVLRADFEVCETYTWQPGRRLSCPISACGGIADPYVGRQQLQDWSALTSGSFSLRLFPGDHFYLNTRRYELLQVIVRDLLPHLN